MRQWLKNFISSKKFQILLLVVLLPPAFLVVMNFYTLSSAPQTNPPSLFGVPDFTAFWTGYQAYKAGLNPYILANVAKFQPEELAVHHRAEILPFLNPPWALFLLSPFLNRPFNSSRFIWIFFNVIACVVSVAVCLNLYKLSVSRIILFLGVLIFSPFIFAVWLGQLSVFLLLFLVLTFYFIERRLNVLAAIATLPLTLKPHLFIVVGIFLCCYLVREKRWSAIVSYLSVFCIFGVTVFIEYQELIVAWQQLDFSPLTYKTPTIVTFVREIMFQITGVVPRWPVYVIPILGGILSLVIFSNSKRPILLKRDFFIAVCLSLAFAPYAWYHDFTLLLSLQIVLIGIAYSGQMGNNLNFAIVYLLLLLQAAVVIESTFTSDLYNYFWFPWAMLSIWVFVVHRFRDRSEILS